MKSKLEDKSSRETRNVGSGNAMQRRRITLSDGRYLIFYTFHQAPANQDSEEDAAAPQPQPQPAEEHDV